MSSLSKEDKKIVVKGLLKFSLIPISLAVFTLLYEHTLKPQDISLTDINNDGVEELFVKRSGDSGETYYPLGRTVSGRQYYEKIGGRKPLEIYRVADTVYVQSFSTIYEFILEVEK